MDKGQFLLYQTPDGDSQIEVKLQNDTVWLSLDQMAELFQRNKSTISRHIKNVLEDGELQEEATIANFATVQNEGTRKVERVIAYYNLDMIISVGYRVHSYRGVQFRIWATKVLKEYIVKGFAMNDDLLKRAGGGNYFDELLARIRDIRSSEKVFYRKVLEIYALSIDYDPRVEMTQKFFKTVQNKMHYSVHGHTAAEIIYERADSEKDFMGLTTWSGAMPTKPEAEIAKNYLTHEEIKSLNRIVSLYLDFAEMQAEEHRPMYMKDWINILDDFLRISRKDILTHAGKISAKLAKEKADQEYDKFKERTKNNLSPVEIHFLENFEREQKRLMGGKDKNKEHKKLMDEEFRYTNKFLRDKLMGEYTLSSKEYRICILVLLAFKPGEMVNLTGFSSSDISKTRQRLLMKLFGEQGSAGQFDKRLRGGIK